MELLYVAASDIGLAPCEVNILVVETIACITKISGSNVMTRTKVVMCNHSLVCRVVAWWGRMECQGRHFDYGLAGISKNIPQTVPDAQHYLYHAFKASQM